AAVAADAAAVLRRARALVGLARVEPRIAVGTHARFDRLFRAHRAVVLLAGLAGRAVGRVPLARQLERTGRRAAGAGRARARATRTARATGRRGLAAARDGAARTARRGRHADAEARAREPDRLVRRHHLHALRH